MAYGWPDERRTTGLPKEAFRPSGVFLGVVALFATFGWMAWRGFGSVAFDVFLFVVAGWVITLCLHEYAHAVFAYLGGDRAVAERGYLTLNPLKYAHPVLSIVLPVVFIILGGIGLPGGAVWVDHSAVRSRAWESVISFAGPFTNLLFAMGLLIPFWLGVDTEAHAGFWGGVAFLALLQIMAAVLNFVPIPGIDGAAIIEPWLSPKWKRGYNYVAPYGMLLLFALLFTGPVNRVFFDFVYSLGDLLGLPGYLAQQGFYLFRFWT